MTVEELIQILSEYPSSLTVEIECRKNYEHDDPYYQYIQVPVDSVIRAYDKLKIVAD